MNETLTQDRVPVVEALLAYSGTVRFHMPGHRGSRFAPPDLVELLGDSAILADVTGVPGLDDLQQPSGILQAAQELAARAFGASYSFFVVNGTTGAVQAMILAALRPGEQLLVPRNIHKSILSGIVLAGAVPVFCMPEYDEYLGIAMGVSLQTVQQKLHSHPATKAVIMVYPTYYGVTTDLMSISSIVHHAGALLLVDEAHGPHFRFHPSFPIPALDCGSDMSAQGIHKVLGSMTQASLLQVKGERVPIWRVTAALRLLQTTSPSYLLLASLDAARKQAFLEGHSMLEKALHLARTLRSEINEIGGFLCFGREILGRPGVTDLDETKLTVTVKELGITGYQAESYLRAKFNVQAEMSDLFNIVFLVSWANTEEQARQLLSALRCLRDDAKSISDKRTRTLLRRASALALPPEPTIAMSPRNAFFAPSEKVPLEDTVGRICAETVTCYPPGIPILCPGEVISSSAVEYLKMVRVTELRVSGPEDPQLRCLRVVAE